MALKPLLLIFPLALAACIPVEGSYEQTDTVTFNGSGNSITETTSGSYRGTEPMVGSAVISSPNVSVGIIASPPRPRAQPPYYTVGRCPAGGGCQYPDPYYQGGSIRTYSDGNTTITRGTGIIYGGCTQTIYRGGQSYQAAVPCR